MIIYYSGAESRYGDMTERLMDDLPIMMTYAKMNVKGQCPRFWQLLEKRRRLQDVGPKQTQERANQDR